MKPETKFNDLVQGYNNFVSTLKLVKKHRPFKSVDNLPKICQPEDNQDINFPRSSSSDESDSKSSLNSSNDSQSSRPHSSSAARRRRNDWSAAKPQFGPSFKLQSLNQMHDGLLSTDAGKIGTHEKQVNVLNLKDILFSKTATP